MYSKDWELLSESDISMTRRLKVPGGWILRVNVYPNERPMLMEMKFISDPKHIWEFDE